MEKSGFIQRCHLKASHQLDLPLGGEVGLVGVFSSVSIFLMMFYCSVDLCGRVAALLGVIY